MKRFITGFVFGLLAFGVSNLVSHFVNSSPIGRTERVLYFGFPFAFWMEGGLPRIEGELSYVALVGDIAIAIMCGTGVGLLFLRRTKHEIS
jgi:hypothetical protein